jgi:hypothetical protein
MTLSFGGLGRIGALFALAIGCCRPSPARGDLDTHPEVAPRHVSAETPDSLVAGYRVSLGADGDQCTLSYRWSADSVGHALRLDLRPPCHLMRWGARAPTEPAASGARPSGAGGSLLAWTYSDADDATVIVVLGSGGDSASTNLAARGCGTRAQGVVLRARGVSRSRRIRDGAPLCAESGLDEKELWLFAHER